ncbi:hypothetical protein A2U01_0064526, partial [Trifolium medium]|nr:hypothetical protein [Trifolium medium]
AGSSLARLPRQASPGDRKLSDPARWESLGLAQLA